MMVVVIDVVIFRGISEKSSGNGGKTWVEALAEVLGESILNCKGPGAGDCDREITMESEAIRVHNHPWYH